MKKETWQTIINVNQFKKCLLCQPNNMMFLQLSQQVKLFSRLNFFNYKLIEEIASVHWIEFAAVILEIKFHYKYFSWNSNISHDKSLIKLM